MQPYRMTGELAAQISAADLAARVVRDPAIAEELARINLHLAPLVDRAWELVRRWPGLRGEDKLAWYCVWRRSRYGRERVMVTAAEIAADQGTTADAGRPRFKKLGSAGLWVIVRHERMTGVYTIEPQQPGEVARALGVQFDPQQFFDFAADSEPTSPTFGPARLDAAGGLPGVNPGSRLSVSGRAAFHPAEDPPEEAPEDPRFPNLETSSPLRIPTSDLKDLETLSRERLAHQGGGNGGSTGGSSPASRGTSAGETELLAEIAARQKQLGIHTDRPAAAPVSESLVRGTTIALTRADHVASFEYRERRVSCLIQEIRQRVNRPGDEIYRDCCARIAWAVVDGHVKESKLSKALRQVDEADRAGKIAKNRSTYMVGCIKALLKEAGIPWEEAPVKPKPK